MFGIGKKKETINPGAKVDEKETEKEIQFDFEENDKLPFDDEEGFADDGFADEDFAEEPSRKGVRQILSQRTLLMVLLLLLALGGGYYFLSGTPAPPPPKPAAVKAKVAVKPATPTAAVAVQPASPAPVAAAPAKSPQPGAVAVKPVSPTPVAAAGVKSQQPASAAIAAAPATRAEVATSAAPSATRQPFTLSAGSFVSQKNLQAVEKKIRRLGYTPKVQASFSMVPMTRLLLGVYDDPAAAGARSRELSRLVPDLFSLKQGASIALYAGSYQDIDEARRFADQLYKHGILADEETVSLRMSVKNVSYGSFASRAAAEKAAKHAATVGLTARVIKR